MESIYLKGAQKTPDWCSEKINIKTYFDAYSNLLKTIGLGLDGPKPSPIEILKRVVPQSKELSDERIEELMQITDGRNLHKILKRTSRRKKCSKETISNSKETTLTKKVTAVNINEESGPSTSSIKEEPQSGPSTSSVCGDVTNTPLSDMRFGKQRNRIEKNSYKRGLVVLDAEKVGRKDLTPYNNYMVSFMIHECFQHKNVGRASVRPGNYVQQIWALGHQKLSDLKDKIICESDFQDVRGDISENPDLPPVQVAKDAFTSSMFFIDDSFYVDTRKDTNIDYSEPIRKWGRTHGIRFGKVCAMEDVALDELTVRMGYPYLYVHQGCCEHIIIINDARLLDPTDSLVSSEYPLTSKLVRHNLIYCMTCSRFPARWIVKDNDRLAHDPTYQCKNCFKNFNYVNGKKVGNFVAYSYLQRSAIL